MYFINVLFYEFGFIESKACVGLTQKLRGGGPLGNKCNQQTAQSASSEAVDKGLLALRFHLASAPRAQYKLPREPRRSPAMPTDKTCSRWSEPAPRLHANKSRSHEFALTPLLFVALVAVLFGTGDTASTAEIAKPKAPTTAGVLAGSKPADWRPIDPANTLYLELAAGRVVIELAPAFAPRHVANVEALAREHYYDGLAIIRVQDNYVVQWADPNAEKPELARKIQHAQHTLPAEFDRPFDRNIRFTSLPDRDVYAPAVGFSNGYPIARDRRSGKMWLIHTYGMVGAGRDKAPDSGGGTELYAVIGHAPRQLDRNVTLIGRVVQGMELLSALPRGTGPMGFYEKPEQHIPIKAIRVASDVPESERSALEVMRTDVKAFQDLIEARRNRREEWFQVPAGHIDIGNVPIPVRSRVPPTQ